MTRARVSLTAAAKEEIKLHKVTGLGIEIHVC